MNEPTDITTSESVLKLKEFDQSNPKLERLLRYSSIYYILVFIFIGLPIWYATTTTYRANLPFADIANISETLIEFKYTFELVFFDKSLNNDDLNRAKDDFVAKLNEKLKKTQGFNIDFDVEFRKSSTKEDQFVVNSIDLIDLDNKLSSIDKSIQKFKIHIFGQNHRSNYEIYDAFLNSLFIKTYDIETIVRIIVTDFIDINHLIKTFETKQESGRRKLPNKDQLRIVSFDSNYEIIFSLINSIPENSNVDWNIENEIKKHFEPILNQLAPYLDFTLKSQELFYSDFDSYKFKSILENGKTTYTLEPSDLSQMTNMIETRIGSQGLQNSVINFVTYIPNRQPLKLETSSNSFLVPRWGGIYIFNSQFDENKQMNIFINQFLKLSGINLQKNENIKSRDLLYSSEIQSYLVKRTFENVLNTINTLQSLASLLEKISNMIISEDIARLVYESVESTKEAIEFARIGKIENAFKASKKAFISSEKAFFDPSLLELLYFPEDQKFAIYIPLFIPVGLPLLLSIKSLYKWFNQQTKKTKTE